MAANILIDALAAVARRTPDAALLHEPAAASHAEVMERAGRMARALAGMGLKPGDRLAAQIEKSPAALELYLATIMAGGVFLPLNTAYTDAELSYFLEDAEPRIMVCDPARAEALSQVAQAAGTAHLLTLDAAGAGSLARAAADEAAPLPPVGRNAEDLAAILYTSGTTGRPKGAMLSHRALRSNAETLREAWAFSSDDVLIHALPVFHTHGLFVATNIVLLSGASMIFLPRFDADRVVEALPRATALMGVPTFYTRLLEHPGLTREACAGMRLFVSGSAPLLPQTHEAWTKQTGHAILERYGMTETNMNTSNPYRGERRPGTVGFPLPGVELRIVEPGGTAELPRGETGMIEVRGPNLFSGYWNKPEKTAEDMREDGFFVTGDLGMRDAEGYVQIVGRAKDLVISGGYNIYPREVEEAIDALSDVRESAVIGVPHPDLGEAAVALVVGGATLTEKGILAGLEGRLARFKQPRRVLIVEELPRNTMGKVQKAALRAEHSRLFAGQDGG